MLKRDVVGKPDAKKSDASPANSRGGIRLPPLSSGPGTSQVVSAVTAQSGAVAPRPLTLSHTAPVGTGTQGSRLAALRPTALVLPKIEGGTIGALRVAGQTAEVSRGWGAARWPTFPAVKMTEAAGAAGAGPADAFDKASADLLAEPDKPERATLDGLGVRGGLAARRRDAASVAPIEEQRAPDRGLLAVEPDQTSAMLRGGAVDRPPVGPPQGSGVFVDVESQPAGSQRTTPNDTLPTAADVPLSHYSHFMSGNTPGASAPPSTHVVARGPKSGGAAPC